MSEPRPSMVAGSIRRILSEKRAAELLNQLTYLGAGWTEWSFVFPRSADGRQTVNLTLGELVEMLEAEHER